MPEGNFNSKGRQPIIPLSLENIDIARIREFVIDYTQNKAYVKNENGELLDISASDKLFEYLKEYLKNHPEIILNVTIIIPGEEQKTIQESLDYIYNAIIKLEQKEYLYAGSTTDGGPASIAEKTEHSISFTNSDNSESFDGSDDHILNLSEDGIFKKSGGYINGDMIPKKKLMLADNVSFGMELPETGEEGQIFVLLNELV